MGMTLEIPAADVLWPVSRDCQPRQWSLSTSDLRSRSYTLAF